jgi:hypothetical protein
VWLASFRLTLHADDVMPLPPGLIPRKREVQSWLSTSSTTTSSNAGRPAPAAPRASSLLARLRGGTAGAADASRADSRAPGHRSELFSDAKRLLLLAFILVTVGVLLAIFVTALQATTGS